MNETTTQVPPTLEDLLKQGRRKIADQEDAAREADRLLQAARKNAWDALRAFVRRTLGDYFAQQLPQGTVPSDFLVSDREQTYGRLFNCPHPCLGITFGVRGWGTTWDDESEGWVWKTDISWYVHSRGRGSEYRVIKDWLVSADDDGVCAPHGRWQTAYETDDPAEAVAVAYDTSLPRYDGCLAECERRNAAGSSPPPPAPAVKQTPPSRGALLLAALRDWLESEGFSRGEG